MNFFLVDNIKKLVAFFKGPFDLLKVPEIFETLAKVFRESQTLIELLFKGSNVAFQHAEPAVSDENLVLELEKLVAELESKPVDLEAKVPAGFGLAELLLIAELIKRILAKKS